MMHHDSIYSSNTSQFANWLALLLILLGAGQYASASDSSKLTVQGKLRESLCQIDMPADMIVAFPDTPTFQLERRTTRVDFDVKLVRCLPAQMARTRMRIKGNRVPNHNVLSLDSGSTAKGVGMGFDIRQPWTNVSINSSLAAPVGDKVSFTAYLVRVKSLGPLEAGKFQFSATLELVHP
ncbi:fimbrial protein [Aeromonas veronii]|uniref:fimbrial protein n=1 Tax=Aeromonas veronii TaxID=654 RepID=UPI003D1C7DBC